MGIATRHFFSETLACSNAEFMIATFVEHIRSGNYNPEPFQDSLISMFHYKVKKTVVAYESRFRDPKACYYNGQNIYSAWESRCRPTIEALFIDHPTKLVRVVNALVEQDNPALFKAFQLSLHHTDLKKSMLFDWNTNMHSQVDKRLSKMKKYGESLQAKGVHDRGEALIKLAHKLSVKLGEYSHPQSELLSLKQAFETLKFKLEFAALLHSEDSRLSVHRHQSKKIVFNLLCILFVGLPNLINLAITGDFLFFNKTTSQDTVFDVQKRLKFNREMQFPFNITAAPI